MLHGGGKEHHALAVGCLVNHVRDNGRCLAPVAVVGAINSLGIELPPAVQGQPCGVISRGVDFPDHRLGEKALVDQFPRAHFIDALGEVRVAGGILTVYPPLWPLSENPSRSQPVRRSGQPQDPQVLVALPHLRDDALDGWRDAVGLINDHQRIAIIPGALECADPVLDGQG